MLKKPCGCAANSPFGSGRRQATRSSRVEKVVFGVICGRSHVETLVARRRRRLLLLLFGHKLTTATSASLGRYIGRRRRGFTTADAVAIQLGRRIIATIQGIGGTVFTLPT